MADMAPAGFDHSFFPTWLKEESGFMFLDKSGDLNIVLGEGGWRDLEHVGILQVPKPGISETLYRLKFKPWGLAAAYRYKNEWHLHDLATCDKEYWEGCRPLSVH